MKVKWLNLRRDLGALGITFGLPIGFFTIFVRHLRFNAHWRRRPGRRTAVVELCVIDEDRSELSERFVDALRECEGLRIVDAPPPAADATSSCR